MIFNEPTPSGDLKIKERTKKGCLRKQTAFST